MSSEMYPDNAQSVNPENDAGDPEALIPEAKHLERLGGPSRISAWRWRQSDPDWPQPIKFHGRIFYVDSESRQYVRRVIARGRGVE
jgi:hypothetical protein